MIIRMNQKTYDKLKEEIDSKNIFSLISYIKNLYTTATIEISNILEDDVIVAEKED